MDDVPGARLRPGAEEGRFESLLEIAALEVRVVLVDGRKDSACHGLVQVMSERTEEPRRSRNHELAKHLRVESVLEESSQLEREAILLDFGRVMLRLDERRSPGPALSHAPLFVANQIARTRPAERIVEFLNQVPLEPAFSPSLRHEDASSARVANKNPGSGHAITPGSALVGHGPHDTTRPLPARGAARIRSGTAHLDRNRAVNRDIRRALS